MKKICTLLCALVLTLTAAAAAPAPAPWEVALADTAAHLAQTPALTGPAGGEWLVLGLARSGAAVPEGYWDKYYVNLEREVNRQNGDLSATKYTEYSRIVLALTALGADPTHVGQWDLLQPLGDFDGVTRQGVNGGAWALLALDSGDYPVPPVSPPRKQATRQGYVDYLLGRQLADGGWALTGQEADPDVTAMVLQALAPYRSRKTVEKACKDGVSRLSALQNPDGSFSARGEKSADSTAQVLLALCALGIPAEDSSFVKDGTILDALLADYRPGAGFSGGSGNDQMTTEQSFCALVALRRAREGQPFLYTMSDRKPLLTKKEEQAGLPGKHSDVKVVPLTGESKTFPDLAGEPCQAAATALVSRGILNGKDDGRFDPRSPMTRGEFAAMTVRALGFTPGKTTDFSDVSDQWFAPWVGAAAGYGIVTGKGDGSFDPLGTISRQEAAVMAQRMAGLCGVDTAGTPGATRDALAPFPDGRQCAPWAGDAVAFCYRTGLWNPEDPAIRPTDRATRGEMAELVYAILKVGKLL